MSLVGEVGSMEGYLGSYCWSEEPDTDGRAPGICMDIGIPEFDEYAPLLSEMARGFLVLQLETPYPDQVTLRLHQDLSEQPVHSEEVFQPKGSIEIHFLPSRDILPGDYVLSVFAYWQGRGDAFYFFPISVPPDETTPPHLRLVVDDQTKITGTLGGYCWRFGCVDGLVFVEHFAILFDPFSDRRQPIRLEFDDPIPTSLNLRVYADLLLQHETLATTELSPDEATITWDVDLASGYYVLAAFATWEEPRGDASYYFGLIIP